jgi:hypothetical protein
MRQAPGPAAPFVSKFTDHHRRCVILGKRFAAFSLDLGDSAALSQLCRASQEMADQAKAARALTEIYLSLDEKHRDAVRAIIVGRFKDILASAEASWRRFCDSMHFIRPATREIQSAIAQAVRPLAGGKGDLDAFDKRPLSVEIFLQRRACAQSCIEKEGRSRGRIRTYDQSVNSRPLYH